MVQGTGTLIVKINSPSGAWDDMTCTHTSTEIFDAAKSGVNVIAHVYVQDTSLCYVAPLTAEYYNKAQFTAPKGSAIYYWQVDSNGEVTYAYVTVGN